MDAARRLCQGDALYAVHAAFVLESTVSASPLHLEDYLLDAADAALVHAYNVGLPVFRLGVPTVHAEEVGGEKPGLLASSAGPYLHDYVFLIAGISGQKGELKLTKQLLGYARKGKYQIKSINLNKLVRGTIDTFGRTRKEITIHYELSDDLPAILADEGQMEQVLLNLYVNAADAMPTGGQFFLITNSVTHADMKNKFFDSTSGNYVQLAITDTGVGMDKNTQERIFEPFFTTKEMGRGTGLGFASVFGIIKGHSGYIDVESKIGHGTTFNIYLPASDQKAFKAVASPDRIRNGSGTILLVDDEKLVLDAGSKILDRLGYTVLEANGGAEAVDVYKDNQEKIDMVILDMIMPGMGGGEVYDRMRSLNPDVRVLLSSGYSIDGQATEILKRGCEDFIQKPFSVKKLSEKISRFLS